MQLQYFEADAPVLEIVEALRQDGAVAVKELAPRSVVDDVASDLRAQFDAEGTYAQCEFNGFKTLRLSSILARSHASAELIGHDRLLEIIDPILLPNCTNYRIGSTTGVEILPGERAQVPHSDGDIYPARIAGLEWQVSAMWALTEFTKENGATRVAIGSHKNLVDGRFKADEMIQSPMPRGSVLIYLGSTVHGGGENRSSAPRMGLVNTYSLGWLRQEVNQYLAVPRSVIEGHSEKIQRLLGYQTHGPYLGKYPDQPDGGWYLGNEAGRGKVYGK